MEELYDVAIIGGGIHGAAIARDAAGRGLRTMLVEMGDLAQATSSRSSKLAHGGLRYLETYRFKMVYEALQEREILRQAAPHLVWPLTFVMPHRPDIRPGWKMRLGIALYDALGGKCDFPAARWGNLPLDATQDILGERWQAGALYGDGWMQDARLVVANALDAASRGATIRTRTRCLLCEKDSGSWKLTLEEDGGKQSTTQAKLVVNAAGPWADLLHERSTNTKGGPKGRLVRGSHIVVRQVAPSEYGYTFQQPDKRIVFMLPFEQNYTLIGTTDINHDGSLLDPEPSDAEVEYLCAAVNQYLKRPIGAGDVVWKYAGVRTLVDHASRTLQGASREMEVTWSGGKGTGTPPIVTIMGGKFTTHRKSAERIVNGMERHIQVEGGAWTKEAPLPGAPSPEGGGSRYFNQLCRKYPWLPSDLALRYYHSYGTIAEKFLSTAHGLGDLGKEICPGLYTAEINYLLRHEWARSADDILWRRTKCGIATREEEKERLEDYVVNFLTHDVYVRRDDGDNLATVKDNRAT